MFVWRLVNLLATNRTCTRTFILEALRHACMHGRWPVIRSPARGRRHHPSAPRHLAAVSLKKRAGKFKILKKTPACVAYFPSLSLLHDLAPFFLSLLPNESFENLLVIYAMTLFFTSLAFSLPLSLCVHITKKC